MYSAQWGVLLCIIRCYLIPSSLSEANEAILTYKGPPTERLKTVTHTHLLHFKHSIVILCRGKTNMGSKFDLRINPQSLYKSGCKVGVGAVRWEIKTWKWKISILKTEGFRKACTPQQTHTYINISIYSHTQFNICVSRVINTHTYNSQQLTPWFISPLLCSEVHITRKFKLKHI